MTDWKTIKAKHIKEEGRFELPDPNGGPSPFLSYKEEGDRAFVTHTYCPPEHSGQGAAAALTAQALAYFAEAGKTVVPLCSYTKRYLERKRP